MLLIIVLYVVFPFLFLSLADNNKDVEHENKTASFYDFCQEDNKRCIGAWDKERNYDCFTERNCTFAAAIEETDSSTYEFRMITKGRQYVSLGFSLDKDMGEDTVVSCLLKDNKIIAEASKNVGHTNQRIGPHYELVLLETATEKDTLYCKFTLKDTLNFIDLDENIEFYILVTGGVLKPNGDLGHHKGHAFSPEKWTFFESPRSSSKMAFPSSVMILMFTYFVMHFK